MVINDFNEFRIAIVPFEKSKPSLINPSRQRLKQNLHWMQCFYAGAILDLVAAAGAGRCNSTGSAVFPY